MDGSESSRNRSLPDNGFGPDNGSLLRTSHPIITEDVEIRGDLTFSGRLEFNGRLEGNLRSGGELIVGGAAVIKGTVEAETADIAGRIQGDVVTAGRVRLRPDAMVYGNVMGGAIVIEEGAIIEGTIMSDRPDRTPQDFSDIFKHLSKGDDGRVRRSGNSSGE